MLGRRSPEAVEELEALQQDERTSAGDPAITRDAVLQLLREDIRREMLSAREDLDNEHLVEEKLEERLRELHVEDPGQWSRFETPGALYGIHKACTRIEEIFARHGWQLPEWPAVGTLATGQPAAQTLAAPGGAPLILIENGFFRFAGMMGRLSVTAAHDVAATGQFSEFTLQLISDLAAAHTVLHTCLRVHPRTLPPPFEEQAAARTEALILFVIAHEYAHLLAGERNPHPLNGSERPLAEKELEADQLGFIIAVESVGEAAIWGAFLYLAGLDLLDRATAAYEGESLSHQSSSASDYPTPYERAVNLLKWMETMQWPPELAGQVTAASHCYQLILFAWDQILPAFSGARLELAAASPVATGKAPYPEAATFAVVSILRAHVQEHLRRR